MLLAPNNGLAELQPGLLRCRGIIGHVRVSSPDVERPAWQQHPRHVAEPGVEQRVERFVLDEVAGSDTGDSHPQLSRPLGRRLGLLRVPGWVEPLVMSRRDLAGLFCGPRPDRH